MKYRKFCNQFTACYRSRNKWKNTFVVSIKYIINSLHLFWKYQERGLNITPFLAYQIFCKQFTFCLSNTSYVNNLLLLWKYQKNVNITLWTMYFFLSIKHCVNNLLLLKISEKVWILLLCEVLNILWTIYFLLKD